MPGNPASTGVFSAPPAGRGPEIDRMVVKLSHLDTLLGLTGEIIISASNLSILQRHLAGSGCTDRETEEMVKTAAMSANRIASELHRLVMDIRMVPIRDTFLRFRRLVRDVARKRGRQVTLEFAGEDTLVDKTVAERLYEPLAHQIRNAIDHGLEDPLERKHAGKDPTGTLTLSASKKEGWTIVSVRDDGRGLDLQGIANTAVRKGLVPAGAVLSAEECCRLILSPGFSTAREATEISGRGVGMDVVKDTVESMGGEVVIESAPGAGSVFTYRIPQLSAVNITDAVIIRAGTGFFAVPVSSVVATQSLRRGSVSTTMGRSESIMYLDSILPLHDLLYLLNGTRLDEGEQTPVIIIEAKNGRIALKVSEFIRPQKLVLIPLPEGFRPAGISGTTILGGSQLGMILEPFELIALAGGTSLEDGSVSAAAALPAGGGASAPEPGRTAVLQAQTEEAEAAARPDTAAPAAAAEMDEDLAEQFFIEIHDILAELNEEVFQLEKEPEEAARVNTIFRHFHSIKGNFMMTGFTAAGAFVHDVETILDQLREKRLEVSQGIIDLLLDTVRLLEDGLAAIRSGRDFVIEESELVSAVRRYRRDDTIAGQHEEDDSGVFGMSPLGTLLFHAKMSREGSNVYQSLIQLSPTFQDPSLVAYLIIRRLTEIADIIDTVPSLERIERGAVREKMKVLFASALPPDDVARFFRNQLQRYYAVDMFENMLME